MAIAPLPDRELLDVLTATRPPLRLLSFPGEGGQAGDPGAERSRTYHRPPGPLSASRRARLRRSGLALLLAGLLGALAVPVSALAGTVPVTGSLTPGATYVVRSGDTLRSIARRLEPTGNPSQLVGQMARQTGSDTVVAGEHIVLP